MHSLQTRRWLGICPRGGLRWLRGAYYTPWQWWKARARRCPGNANAQTWSLFLLTLHFWYFIPDKTFLLKPALFSSAAPSWCTLASLRNVRWSIYIQHRLLLMEFVSLFTCRGKDIVSQKTLKSWGSDFEQKNCWLKSWRWGRKRRLGTGRFIGNLWSAYGPLMVSWWSIFWQFWSRRRPNHSPAVWESCSTLFAFGILSSQM